MRSVLWGSLVVMGLVAAGPASGAVLCANKKGGVIRRESACKGKEQTLQLSDFGATGPKGDKGNKGDQGDPGPLIDTLPSGKTLRGTFFLNLVATAGGQEVGSAVPFGFRLASEPTVHFVTSGGVAPAACPGTASVPEAMPGHFCMYENWALRVSAQGICGTGGASCTVTAGATNRYGAYYFALSTGSGNAQTAGTWAVTAP